MLRWVRRQFTPERCRYVVVGAGMTGLNMLLLTLLVSLCSINPLLANGGRTVVTTQVDFFLYRKYTWKGEHKLSVWRQWRRYHILKAGTMVCSQLLFAVLTSLSLHYLPAYLISTVSFGVVKFSVLRLIFGNR